jgi:hypothetical protein
MPHFVHDEGGYFLSTSLKAMFSTLKAQARLRPAGRGELWRHALAQRLPLVPVEPHYLIVRDPFARIESFYRDKILQDPSLRGPFGYDDWQHCQRLLFPHIGVTREHAPHEIAARLRALPFERFLDVLPSVYRGDAHLAPQAETRWVRLAGPLRLALRFERVFRMERPGDLEALAKLGIDLSTPANSTAEVEFAPRWSPARRALVARLYRGDLESFGYAAR